MPTKKKTSLLSPDSADKAPEPNNPEYRWLRNERVRKGDRFQIASPRDGHATGDLTKLSPIAPGWFAAGPTFLTGHWYGYVRKRKAAAAFCAPRLFVWTGFAPDYSDGLAFAIARDEADARKQIEDKIGFPPSVWGELQVLPVSKRCAFCVSGGG